MKKGLIILLVCILGVGGMWFFNKKEKVKELPVPEGKLNSYSYSYGGNENGNGHDIDINALDDEYAIIVKADTEAFWIDDTIVQYRVPLQILDDIQEVFMKHKMYNWVGANFSDMFIDDGETESHHFRFENDSYNFSSQIFENPYRDGLRDIDTVVDKYIEEGELLPGLVANQSFTEEELYARRYPENGQVLFEVYGYNGKSLRYRILNGLDETITYKDDCKLYNSSNDVLYEDTSEYESEVDEHSVYEGSIRLSYNFFEPGKYRLVIDEFECEFEIK